MVEWLKKIMGEKVSLILTAALTLAFVPGLMAEQNWNDHDRSGKYACRDFAADYLNSCGKQGILFTNGDNDILSRSGTTRKWKASAPMYGW